MLRRMALLARLRAEVEQGSSSPPSWRHGQVLVLEGERRGRAAASRAGARDLLAKAMTRLLEAERQVKAPGGVGPLAADEELFAICRQAARLR